MNSGSKNAFSLAGWIALSFLPAATGVIAPPGEWYANLVKPSWNPPSWIFGPVWSALYLMMGISAWLVWRRGGFSEQRKPLCIYLTQLALNALWTPLFFGLKQPGLAFAEILFLWGAILATILTFRRVSKGAAWLLIPYILWVSFASALNFTLWRLND